MQELMLYKATGCVHEWLERNQLHLPGTDIVQMGYKAIHLYSSGNALTLYDAVQSVMTESKQAV